MAADCAGPRLPEEDGSDSTSARRPSSRHLAADGTDREDGALLSSSREILANARPLRLQLALRLARPLGPYLLATCALAGCALAAWGATSPRASRRAVGLYGGAAAAAPVGGVAAHVSDGAAEGSDAWSAAAFGSGESAPSPPAPGGLFIVASPGAHYGGRESSTTWTYTITATATSTTWTETSTSTWPVATTTTWTSTLYVPPVPPVTVPPAVPTPPPAGPTTTAVTTALPCGLVQEGTRYPGNDLRSLPGVPSAQECCQQCGAESRCVAWTWGKERNAPFSDVCYLKGDQPRSWINPVSDDAFTSGQPLEVHRSIPTRERRGDSLFCWVLMVASSYEPGLLARQYERSHGIFACDEYVVYSNQDFEVAEGVHSLVFNRNLHVEYGGEFKTALNNDIFLGLWGRIVKDGVYMSHDWTVKADADTVFFAGRLRAVLQEHPEREGGVYLNNCKFGLHGPLEVLSTGAVQAYAWGESRCVQHFKKLCSGDCKWGEDMFMDQCLSKVLGMARADEFTLLREDHCDPPPGWRTCGDPSVVAFHPYKDTAALDLCINTAENAAATQEAA